MDIAGTFLADPNRRSPMSGWWRDWMSSESLFWAGAIGSVLWALIHNPRMTSPKVGGEAAHMVESRAILVHQFALGGISAREFTRQCAALPE